MAWRGGIPHNPSMRSRHDDELAQIGDDLIAEAYGGRKNSAGARSMGGLSESCFLKSESKFRERTLTLARPGTDRGDEDVLDGRPSTARLAVLEMLDAVVRADLTDRELMVVMRRHEGVFAAVVAHEIGCTVEAVDAAFARGVAALERACARSPLFGLRDAYREDLRRVRHRRAPHNRPRHRRTN